jgi:hypothetical protein
MWCESLRKNILTKLLWLNNGVSSAVTCIHSPSCYIIFLRSSGLIHHTLLHHWIDIERMDQPYITRLPPALRPDLIFLLASVYFISSCSFLDCTSSPPHWPSCTTPVTSHVFGTVICTVSMNENPWSESSSQISIKLLSNSNPDLNFNFHLKSVELWRKCQ